MWQVLIEFSIQRRHCQFGFYGIICAIVHRLVPACNCAEVKIRLKFVCKKMRPYGQFACQILESCNFFLEFLTCLKQYEKFGITGIIHYYYIELLFIIDFFLKISVWRIKNTCFKKYFLAKSEDHANDLVNKLLDFSAKCLRNICDFFWYVKKEIRLESTSNFLATEAMK